MMERDNQGNIWRTREEFIEHLYSNLISGILNGQVSMIRTNLQNIIDKAIEDHINELHGDRYDT